MLNRKQDLYVHLIWSTADRLPLLIDAVLAWLLPSLADQARAAGCAWAVAGGHADHVHVLVSLPTTVTVSGLVQKLKGWSSRASKQHGPSPIFWQAGFGAFSVSVDAVSRVEAYVRNQAEHHASGTVERQWE